MASIIKTNKGMWAYRVHRTIDDKEINKYKSGFRTKAEAKRAALELESQIDNGLQVNNNISFADYFLKWAQVYVIGKQSVDVDKSINLIYQRIKNYFGTTPLAKIKKITYQKFINDMTEQHHLAKRTIIKYNTYINKMVNNAIDEGIIIRSFTNHIQNYGHEGKKANKKFLDLANFEKLINYAFKVASIDYPIASMTAFAGLTGARASEVLGMTWHDVDFENHTITINKIYSPERKLKKTKTPSSVRTIAIPNNLINLLKQLKHAQQAYYLATGYRDHDNFIFRNAKTLHIFTNRNINYRFYHLQSKAGIPVDKQISFHGLRHTHASYLISNNVPISYISKRLGHKDISVTLKTYAHLLDEIEQKNNQQAMNLLDKIN